MDLSNQLNYHESANVDVASSAQIKKSSIRVAVGGNLIIEDGADIEGCNFDVASGTTARIGKNSRLKEAVLKVRRGGAAFRLGEYCTINNRSIIFADRLIEIGNYVLIGANCFITDSQIHSTDWKQRRREIEQSRLNKVLSQWIKRVPLLIKDDCWIGYNSQILVAKDGEKKLILGRGTIVGSSSVVKESFEDEFQIIAGVPARFICYAEPFDTPTGPQS